MNENIIEFDELCKRAKSGDSNAVWLITLKLRPFIIKCSHSIYLKNYDLEDIISVATVALLKSIKCFKLNGNKNFFPYAIITIKNALNMEIRKGARHWKESSLDNYLEQNGEVITSYDDQKSIEEEYINKELVKSRLEVLNNEERKLIFSLYYKGTSIAKYASVKNLDYKKCSNMKLKALRKMKKVR